MVEQKCPKPATSTTSTVHARFRRVNNPNCARIVDYVMGKLNCRFAVLVSVEIQ